MVSPPRSPATSNASAAQPLSAGIGFGSIEEIYAVNIFGTSCLVKAVRPIILSSISGRIVNVSSETGSLAATLKPDCWWLDNVPSAYTTSKTALNGLTVAWAVEERRKGDGRASRVRLPRSVPYLRLLHPCSL